MSDRAEGTQVRLNTGTVYEWDGADWFCPTLDHDAETNFDWLLDLAAELQAARDGGAGCPR